MILYFKSWIIEKIKDQKLVILIKYVTLLAFKATGNSKLLRKNNLYDYAYIFYIYMNIYIYSGTPYMY